MHGYYGIGEVFVKVANLERAAAFYRNRPPNLPLLVSSDLSLIFMANHRCDPTKSVEEWKAFEKRYIDCFEEAEAPPIK